MPARGHYEDISTHDQVTASLHGRLVVLPTQAPSSRLRAGFIIWGFTELHVISRGQVRWQVCIEVMAEGDALLVAFLDPTELFNSRFYTKNDSSSRP